MHLRFVAHPLVRIRVGDVAGVAHQVLEVLWRKGGKLFTCVCDSQSFFLLNSIFIKIVKPKKWKEIPSYIFFGDGLKHRLHKLRYKVEQTLCRGGWRFYSSHPSLNQFSSSLITSSFHFILSSIILIPRYFDWWFCGSVLGGWFIDENKLWSRSPSNYRNRAPNGLLSSFS